MNNSLHQTLAIVGAALCGLLTSEKIQAAEASVAPAAVDPLVKASPYGAKSVWSYSSNDPLPWTMFHPRDFGSSKIVFNAEGVTPVGKVPAPGVHPRIFFSPEDLPAIRKRIQEDPGAQAAWKDILCYSHALKLNYDEKADYAQPDWAKGSFHVHGRTDQIMRIGGYGKNREDYFALLAAGQPAPKTYGNQPSGFFFPAAVEAYRCLIADDADGARKLAKAVETSVRLEQARRAREDKPAQLGQPPKPSTPRYHACNLGLIYDFIYNWLTPEQKKLLHDELVLLSAWHDNYGAFNNAEASRSNWATFTYWVWDLMAIEGEPGFNDLKFLGLYRGWRNLFTYSFFDSGAFYEGEGKMLFGLDAVVAFDRVAPKYGLEPLSQHPLVRAHYAKFTALSVLPTKDKFAIFDILGSMGGGLCTPQDVVTAHYLFPHDSTIDFVYRTTVGNDYSRIPMPGHSWNNLITDGIFATSHHVEITPDKLNLPLSFFCGQRAMMMTRSSWDTNATMLTMHVRGASGGHPYPDRNGIMLAAQGRTWVTIPGKDIGGWAMNTVLIDSATQTPSTPGRVVDYVDESKATFMVGDAKYCWDWVWRTAAKNKQGGDITRADVVNDNVDTAPSWHLLDQCFNDFAYTKSEREIYRRPLKFSAHWIAPDGTLSPYMRQVNMPVLKAFRTAGLVRGPHPYVLVVDDVQRDALPCRYDWNLTLAGDVIKLTKPMPIAGEATDVILAGKDSVDAAGAIKPGEPALLLRVLDGAGQPQIEINLRDRLNLLSLHTVAAAPSFKVLLYAFRAGDPLPKTIWNSSHTTVSVAFPEQQDAISFAPSTSGKTDVLVKRGADVLARVSQPVVPLADADSAALTARLSLIPARLAALREQDYNPLKQTGFVAGWNFDRVVNGSIHPLPGSVAAAAPISLGGSKLVAGMNGCQAVATSSNSLTASLDFAKGVKGEPFTVACWLKTKPGPYMGGLVKVEGIADLSFAQGGLRVNVARALNDNWPASMLSSWTHLVFTGDGRQLCAYRNGMLIASAPLPADAPINWGKKFSFGGKAYNDDPEVVVQSLYFYQTAFTAEAVNNLYLWGRAATR